MRLRLSVYVAAVLWIPGSLAGGTFAAEPAVTAAGDPSVLPGTQLLTWTGDIASRLVNGADRFLLGEIAKSIERRARFWNRDKSSGDAYYASIEPNRKRLEHILGIRDARVPFDSPELVGSVTAGPVIVRGDGYRVVAVRWPVVGDVHGEGLLLIPEAAPRADVIAIPDADETPEMLAGLVPGTAAESQFARRLAENGCRVLVPTLISRGTKHGKLSNREFLYRSAFELGRHVIGYEAEKVLAGVDWFSREYEAWPHGRPIGVMGWGEGGMLALYAGALDRRIAAVCTSGYFDSRQNLWQEPLERNVFGLLEQFGDAELASMIAPRRLVIEAARGPECVIPPGTGGGPGRLVTPKLEDVQHEAARARRLLEGLNPPPRIDLIVCGDGNGRAGSDGALQAFLDALGIGRRLAGSGAAQVVGDPAGCRGPAGPAIPRDRSPQPAVARGKPVRAAAVLREARYEFFRGVSKERRALSRVLRQGGHRPLRHPSAAGQPADPQEL